MRTSVDYDLHQHRVYDEGRALSPARAELWRRVYRRYLGRRPLRLLDLGCGTGMYSELLAEAFDANVVGVDPSIRMREVAEREHAHPRVRYVEGNAEQIPLGDASCDASLLSQVAHHIADPAACARELWRVIRPSGSVLVRGILPESLPSVRFLEFFPPAAAVAAFQAAALAHFLDVLAEGGFRLVAHEAVEQESAPGLLAYHERVKLRAISTLELIDDADFEGGVERLRRLAERESEPEPVIERIDLAVLQRS